MADDEQPYLKGELVVCDQCAGVRPASPQPLSYATPQPPKKKRTGLIIGLVVGAVLLTAAGFFAFSGPKFQPTAPPKLLSDVTSGPQPPIRIADDRPPIPGLDGLQNELPPNLYSIGPDKLLDLDRANGWLQANLIGRRFSITATVVKIDADDNGNTVINARDPADPTSTAPHACTIAARVAGGAEGIKEGDRITLIGRIEEALCQDGALSRDNAVRSKQLLFHLRLADAEVKGK